MDRPRHQRAEPEAMQEVVDGLLAQVDAELGGEDAADVGAVEGADAVLGGRPGLDPLPKAVVLGEVEPGLAAAPGSVGQGVGAPVVITPRPLLDGAWGAAEGRGDLGGRLAGGSQDDRAEPTPEARRRLSGGELLDLFGGVVGLDVDRVPGAALDGSCLFVSCGR